MQTDQPDLHRATRAVLPCLVVMVAAVLAAWSPARARSTASDAVAPASGWQPTLLLRAGSLGVGPELDVRVPHTAFGVRAGVNGLAFSANGVISSHLAHSETAYSYDSTIRYGGTAKLLNGGVMGDYYPYGTGLRMSLGVLVNGNEVTLHGVPTGQMRIGSTTYSGSAPGSVEAGATFNALAPVATIGYSAQLGPVRISADLGAMYQGDPHLSYGMQGAFTALPAVAPDAQRERERLQRESDIPIYPVCMLGIGWMF